MATKKRFFANHAKSSAALISLIIHAVLIVVAFTFVAVTVIQREDKSFEAKPVKRPKMQLKKLKVPVNVKKKKMQKPKLRKRIVVQPKLNQNMPDIKMPEISGVKGGMGSAAGDGLGGAAGLGFSMPEIEIFGIKGKGEKIVLALNCGTDMMIDQRGGIPAYTIIKDELIRIVEELPSTALFNVIVYDWKQDAMAFPNLVPANAANAKKLKVWLTPLNAVRKGMREGDWGIHTLGKGGVSSSDKMLIGKFQDTKKVKGNGEPDVRNWYRASMLAQKMQADTIFLLTDTWDNQRVKTTGAGMSRKEWDLTSAGKKWNAAYKKALKTLDEENKKRRAAGQPPKAINRNEWDMRKDYYPDIETPPKPGWYLYTPKDFAEAFLLTRDKYKPKTVQARSGIGRKKKKSKIDFSFNVIQFIPQGGETESYFNSEAKFGKLTSICHGDYKTISGLSEVQSYVTSEE